MQFYDSPKNFLKLWILIGFVSPGCTRASGDMVGIFVSSFDLWGCPGARVMTIFVSHVGRHFTNIGYFEVYGRIWGYMKFEGI